MEQAGSTEGIRVMLGDPKKAILTFAIPLAVALLVQQSNNIVDSIWVSGLGAAPMAALGVVYPIYAVMLGIGNGLGIGASAAISRKIGAGKKDEAEGVLGQSLFLVAVVSVVLMSILLITAEPLLSLIGAGNTMEDSLAYAYPLYIATLPILMSGLMSGLLRGEGAAKRSMYIQIMAAITNLILDPILIYGLDMGVAGAAWATVISFVVSVVAALYWYCVKRDLFLKMRLNCMKFDKNRMKDILSVGLPEAIELSAMNLFNIIFNFCVIAVGTTDAVAIYAVAWRIAYVLMIPAQALGGAIVSACSAEYGMRRFDMINTAYRYSAKSAVIWLLVASVVLALCAGIVASAFTYSSDMQHMHEDMTSLIRYFAIFLPFMSMIFVGSSMLQALNHAGVAMMSTIIRNVLLTVGFVLMAYTVGTLPSLWAVLTLGEIFGGILMWYLAKVVLEDSFLKNRMAVRG